MGKFYVLVEKTPKEVEIIEWKKWFEIYENRIVKKDCAKEITVVTEFTGCSHNFSSHDRISTSMFVTKIVGGDLDGFEMWNASYESAEEAHREILKKVKESSKIISANAL